MALVLVLLFATLCGVHTASISKSDALDVTLDTLDSKLEGLDPQTSDHIKQKVLDGVKRLLDLQLAALVKDGERADVEGISKKGTLKSKSKTRSRLLRRNEKNKESSSLEEVSQNSELTSLLSDESIPDPSDETIRNAVDKLLNDNKDIILEDKDEIILDNNVDAYLQKKLELENSTNNNTGDIMSQIEYDKIASQLIKASRGSVEKHVDSTTKHSKHNKKIKDEFNHNKADNNLDELINRLMKPDNDTERNKNHNKKLIYETYKPRQKIDKRVYSYNKKSHNKMRHNENQDIKKHINDNNNKFATKLIQTEINEHDDRKSGYDVHEKKRDDSRNNWQLNLGAEDLVNQETNKMNNAQSKKTHENAKNNERYVVIRDGEVKNEIDYEDIVYEENNNDEEKENIITTKYGVERSDLINDQKKKKQLTSDEYDTNTLILQANKDIANEKTRDDIHHRNDITDMKDVIIKYEVNLNNDDKSITFDENSNEDTSDEKKKKLRKAIEINMNKNGNNNERTKKDTNDLKHGALHCHHETEHDSGDSKLIRDLIQNNDIKKSIAFSLNFTSQ